MLVLSRRSGESLMVGEDIRISVLAVHGTQVRIGITAPREVGVHREEVFVRINKQRRGDKDNQ